MKLYKSLEVYVYNITQYILVNVLFAVGKSWYTSDAEA